MTSSWSLDTRFRRTEIDKFPLDSRTKTEDNEYWKHLQHPVSIQEFGPISHIDICQQAPHYISVTASTRVQIFNPLSNDVHKSLTKFREAAYGGKFRSDGQLLSVGSDDGKVRIFSIASKTLLRTFEGHENATHRSDFLLDGKHVASFSDDKTVRVWDMAVETETAKFAEHKDYVRTGCVSHTSSDILVSGSYDHTVRVWDRRQAGSTVQLTHGSPVESVLLVPNGTLLITAGGHEIKIWDLLAGGRLLTVMAPHNKTVTSLGLASRGSRLVTSSLDRQVKFHNISSFKTVHSIPFPSPILTVAVSYDDSILCAGMSDGLVQFMHRKVPPSLAEMEEAKLRQKSSHKYLQYTHFTAQDGDVVIKQDKREKESRHDFFLRKFEFTKALDQVLKPYVQQKLPEYTYSVLKELKRRNKLEAALAGRNEKSLTSLLQYLSKYINDPRFSPLLMEVTNSVLDLYGPSLGNCPSTDRLFVEIRKRVDREARSMRHLLALQGSLDLILTSAVATEKPELRCEEKAFKKNYCKSKAGERVDIELTSDKNVMSWQKTLLT